MGNKKNICIKILILIFSMILCLLFIKVNDSIVPFYYTPSIFTVKIGTHFSKGHNIIEVEEIFDILEKVELEEIGTLDIISNTSIDDIYCIELEHLKNKVAITIDFYDDFTYAVINSKNIFGVEKSINYVISNPDMLRSFFIENELYVSPNEKIKIETYIEELIGKMTLKELASYMYPQVENTTGSIEVERIPNDLKVSFNNSNIYTCILWNLENETKYRSCISTLGPNGVIYNIIFELIKKDEIYLPTYFSIIK